MRPAALTIPFQVVGLIRPAGGFGGVADRCAATTVLSKEVGQGEGLPFLILLLSYTPKILKKSYN